MNRAIDILRQPRQFLLNVISELTPEQLNKIPEGFNNNIIWNLGHMIAAQQGICYKRTGVDIIVTDEFFETYKPGTKPLKDVEADEVAIVKELIFTSLDRLEADLEKGIFNTYAPVTTRYGVKLHSIEEAIAFLPFHDGFHMGYIMALKRVI